MIDDIYQAGTDRALDDRVSRAPPPRPPEGEYNFWSTLTRTVPRAIGGGFTGFASSAASVIGAYAQVEGARDTADLTPEQQRQTEAARKKMLEGIDFSNPASDFLRAKAEHLMPDPLTAHRADQIVGGLFGGLSEFAGSALFGGPLAPLVFGGSMGLGEADKLKAKGVPLETRTKAATLFGAGQGALAVVPVVGRGLAQTAGLVAASGTGNLATIAAEQTILRHAGLDKLAATYDPFDPWTVGMSYGFPAVLGGAASAVRAIGSRPSLADVVLSNESGGRRYGKDGALLTSPKGAQGEMQVMPKTATDPGFGVLPARDGSPDELARVGRDYLSAMEQRYGGDQAKAMAAYNAGPGAVDAALKAGDGWLAKLPAETQTYVANGLRKLGEERTAAHVRANPELVDAARARQTARVADSSRLTPDGDLAGMNEHVAALARATEQLSNGEPVSVGEFFTRRDAEPANQVQIADRMPLLAPHIDRLDSAQHPALRNLYAAAAREKAGFDASVVEVAQAAGGQASLTDLKGPGRAVAKIVDDYGGEAGKIKDLLRATIIVESVDAARGAVAGIFGRYKVLESGRRNLLDPGLQPIDGYRDAKFNVEINGHVAEIQVNVPAMEAAKKAKGHKFYEEREELTRSAKGRVFSDAEQARYDQLNAEMRAIYEPEWAEATRARNASSETGAPLRRIESDGNDRGSSLSQATQMEGPAPALNETGIPSTSKNSALGANETGSISTAPSIPLAATGNAATALTTRGTEIPVRWALVEARDLVTSHTDELVTNPGFPAELQPRDRGRAASEQQIASMENALKPQLLGESATAADGAPIIGKDGVVESGNARTIALRRAYASGKADAYRDWLETSAPKVGIDANAIAGMDAPVLVRVGDGGYDRAEFARQANESGVALMSQTEQARADAARLPEMQDLVANDDGTINVAQSGDFIRAFVQHAVSPADRGSMMTAGGELSQQGAKRIRDAVFARAYADPELVAMMAEATDVNVKNVLAGMLRAAPRVAQVIDLQDAGARPAGDFTASIVEAVRKFSQLRADGMTVEHYLAQRGMFDDGLSPQAETMLQQLSADSRAPRRVADMITARADAVDGLGDPRQAGMFDEPAEAIPSPFKTAVAEARSVLTPGKATGQAVAELEAAGKLTPLANNTLLGLAEAGGDPKRVKALIGHADDLAAKAPGRPPGDVMADAVERMRTSEPVPESAPMAAASIVEQTQPDLPVRITEDGKVVTAKDELEAVRREAMEGTADTLGADHAALLEVAANCFLTGG